MLSHATKKKTPQLRGSLFGTPGRIRTYDLWLRKPTLYPAELRVQNILQIRHCVRFKSCDPSWIERTRYLYLSAPPLPAELRVLGIETKPRGFFSTELAGNPHSTNAEPLLLFFPFA